MKCQKELFSLREGVHYLNCAYKGPMLKASEEAGMKNLLRDRNPMDLQVDDYFEDNQKVRLYFGLLVNAPAANIAIVPSTSYGFASVLNNIPAKKNGHAIGIHNEFPSAHFSLKRWCTETQSELKIIAPGEGNRVGAKWNQDLLDSINEDTSVVLLSSVHWMNGLRFDLEKIGAKCRAMGAKFLVDGTQSVGALEMDVQRYHIDALVCAAYKWLFGPYSLALAYISDDFSNGRPLEETWMNRTNARNFSGLTEYEISYMPHAGRYNMGETSSFILMAILREALRQVLEWQPVEITAYCTKLIQPLRTYLHEQKIELEDEAYFSNHLFALPLPKGVEMESLKEQLEAHNIVISVRGAYLRVAVNVFNDAADIQALIQVLKAVTK